MRSFAIVPLLLLLAASCAANNETAETVHDPCSPLLVVVASTIEQPERDGVAGAIAAWQARLPTQMRLHEGARSGPDEATPVLPIRFSADSGLRAAYWEHDGSISISSNLLAADEFPVAIAHEMGHAFGLPHVSPDDRPSVMNIGNVALAPNEGDAGAVRALWSTCASD